MREVRFMVDSFQRARETAHNQYNIMNYIDTIKAVSEFRKDYSINQIRKEFMQGGERELRTKKNDHIAVSWDELGNAFVLTKSGTRKQLIGNEYQGR